MQADTLQHWSSTQLFGFIQQASQRAERIHDVLVCEHEQQERQLHEVIEKRDQLRQVNNDLQVQVEQVTDKFPTLWPTISNLVIEAPEDFTSCTLVTYYDHIQEVSSILVAMNAYMKRKLETIKSVLPILTEIYA